MDDRALLATGCVALNLRRASRIVTRLYEDALRPVDLTSFQFSTLAALSEYPKLSQSAMAHAFGMSISTVGRNLAPLAARGLVAITPGEDDRRERIVRLTEAGRAVFEDAVPLWAKAQRDALAAIGDERWQAIRADLKRLPN